MILELITHAINVLQYVRSHLLLITPIYLADGLKFGFKEATATR